MRILLLFFVVFFCVVSSCIAQPRLQVESTEINWGEIYSGEKKEHRFILRNNGDSALVITRVRSSCGCTAALVSSKTILPDEQAELHVRFNSKRFRGQVTKRVCVVSNDPQQPKKRFTLRASIVPELVMTPSRLSLGSIPADKDFVRNLSLVNHSDLPIQIKAVRSTSRHMTLANIPTSLEPNEEAVVILTVHPPKSATVVLNGYILIDAQGHTRKQLRIPVMAKIAKNLPSPPQKTTRKQSEPQPNMHQK
ncbi:MAG: DUF1573 domain-containing protein [Thermodesulfobacteriota bacterium]|nr:DUF1573 domain-containing protein [Thermodesulfobacteriota bacterium]